jgi:DNA-directed RNA polymerase specialized sigma24 family protein
LETEEANAECVALVIEHDALLRRYARACVGSEADDVVNDVWEAVLKSRRLVSPPVRWDAYLFSALRRKVGQRWKEQRDRPALVELDDKMTDTALASPFDSVENLALVRRLRSLVPEVLSKAELLTVVLHAYKFSDPEIAEYAKIKHVAKVRERALVKIRKALGYKLPRPAKSQPGSTKG